MAPYQVQYRDHWLFTPPLGAGGLTTLQMLKLPISCTSHISTADLDGNLVALTQTHGGGFGSMVSVSGTGLLLGHGVGRFDPRPELVNSIAPANRRCIICHR